MDKHASRRQRITRGQFVRKPRGVPRQVNLSKTAIRVLRRLIPLPGRHGRPAERVLARARRSP
jgi:hypothetical protein